MYIVVVIKLRILRLRKEKHMFKILAKNLSGKKSITEPYISLQDKIKINI
jgi:hypothetical protein